MLPVLVVLCFVPYVGAQTSGETILRSYERIFIRSNLSMKVNVLLDAANDEAADEFYGAFCELALRFVMDNAPLFPDDPDMINITVGAIKGVGKYAYSPAAETMWEVFLRFPDNVIRLEILRTLPALNAPVLPEMANQFLMEQNRLYGTGQEADSQVLSTLFAALGEMGDDSSYQALFASSLIYSGSLEREAARALYRIDGDFYEFCMKIILNNPPAEKLEALKLALTREDLSGEQKGALAEASLETALAFLSGERRSQNRDLAGLSVKLIADMERVSALPLILKYYNQSLESFRRDPSQKQSLLDAVSCLAALKNSDAARLLSLQLGVYNSRVDSLNPEEREVALALISALGSLGYKIAYDSIYQASRLPYPKEIQDSAQRALQNLRW